MIAALSGEVTALVGLYLPYPRLVLAAEILGLQPHF